MKTILSILTITFCISLSTLSAQFSFGVEAGYNRSTLTDDFPADFTTSIDISEKDGFYFGLTPTFSLTKKLSLLAEVQYSQEGHKVNLTDGQFKNIRLRILPQLEYRLIKPLGLLAGLNVGFQLSELAKVGENPWEDTVTSSLSSNDAGFTVGARIHVNKFHITARYNQGLKNINELTFTDMNGNPIGEVALKSQHYQIGIGYTFGKG